jgi:hypothetical protein
MGSLLVMIGGNLDEGRREEHYDELLDTLRSNPLDFIARIEGAVEMRDSIDLIVGASD